MDINYTELYQQYKLNEQAQAEAEWESKYGDAYRRAMKHMWEE